MCWNYKKCQPNIFAGNIGHFNGYLREEKKNYSLDAKEMKNVYRKFKEINNDLAGFSYSFYEEQSNFNRDIKKNSNSYLREIEKELEDGNSRYSELVEIKNEFSHIVESGSSSTKEINIEGSGLRGKLLALTAGISDDPKNMGKLLSDNPSNAQTALLLFSPVCSLKCSNNRRDLFALWYVIFNDCWKSYLVNNWHRFPCWKRRKYIRKLFQKLCRARGLKRAVIRLLINYLRRHMRKAICHWK